MRAIKFTLPFLAAALVWAEAPQDRLSYPLPEASSYEHESEEERMGGLIVFDVDGDGNRDILISEPGRVQAFSPVKGLLWGVETDILLSSKSQSRGLPGKHAPGLQAGDPDLDGQPDILFLSTKGELVVLSAKTGEERKRTFVPVPFEQKKNWEHLVLMSADGKKDDHVVLQTTNEEGYQMGRFVAVYDFNHLDKGPVWKTDQYLGCAHNGLRVSDLNGDGRDEILGATIFSPEGVSSAQKLYPRKVWADGFIWRLYDALVDFPNYAGHLDAVAAADILPDVPGLEVAGLQEGGKNRIFVFNRDGLLWEADHENQEPQNMAIGDFDLNSPGLEIWCRSRYETEQKPFVFSSDGKLASSWEMKKKAPKDWTNEGIEEIFAIHWDGSGRQVLAAKERHKAGDIALIDAMTGEFIQRFKTRARRIFVADIMGDWREEILVLTPSSLEIFSNSTTLPKEMRDQERLWNLNGYKRAKMTHNYYST